MMVAGFAGPAAALGAPMVRKLRKKTIRPLRAIEAAAITL